MEGVKKMIRKFKCEVTRVDTYEIEIDDAVMTEQWMSDFRKVYYDIDDLAEHAEHIAQMRARFGSYDFEGYGIPLRNGEVPHLPDSQKNRLNTAININIVNEDNDIEVEVSESVVTAKED
jgi:hypothetical protein